MAFFEERELVVFEQNRHLTICVEESVIERKLSEHKLSDTSSDADWFQQVKALRVTIWQVFREVDNQNQSS